MLSITSRMLSSPCEQRQFKRRTLVWPTFPGGGSGLHGHGEERWPQEDVQDLVPVGGAGERAHRPLKQRRLGCVCARRLPHQQTHLAPAHARQVAVQRQARRHHLCAGAVLWTQRKRDTH